MIETNGIEIVDRIDRLLKKRGEKRPDLSKNLNISKSTISNWYIRGTVPAADVLLKIAQYLNVDITYLITGESDIPMLNESDQLLLGKWNKLTDQEKEIVNAIIDVMIKSFKG